MADEKKKHSPESVATRIAKALLRVTPAPKKPRKRRKDAK